MTRIEMYRMPCRLLAISPSGAAFSGRGFALIELFFVVVVILILAVGGNPKSLSTWLIAFPLAIGLIVGISMIVRGVLENVSMAPWRQKEFSLSSRRRMFRDRLTRTNLEARLEALDDTELAAYIEKHPRDATAVELHCERLWKQRRRAEWARETEYLLTLKHGMSVEEVCSRMLKLASVYRDDLNRPDRARETLHTIVATYPQHYQATLAREQIKRLDGSLDEQT